MIRAVSYATILDAPNAKELLDEYAAECSLPELGAASPQRELYEMLEKSGGFQAFGVYDSDVLIGFASVLMYVLPHYGKKIATNESIFVSSSVRGEGYGVRKFIKQWGKDNNCVVFLYTAPVGSEFDKSLAADERCRHTNNVYVEVL